MVCVKQEPHEASLAPFTPSLLAASGLAELLPFQPGVSVDASTPCYGAYGHHGPSYGQYASQPFIAGTNPWERKKIHCTLRWLGRDSYCPTLAQSY